jgi:hypothetical protein
MLKSVGPSKRKVKTKKKTDQELFRELVEAAKKRKK